MKRDSLFFVFTLVNFALLTLSLIQSPVTQAEGVAPVLRGRALEILDDRGRVRASITLQPADPAFRMPDGTTGYPETILFRLIDPNGRPNAKIEASALGAGVGLGGESDPTYASLMAKGARTALQLTNQDGRRQLITP